MRSDTDEGFSLLEVLLCVVLIGMLAPVIVTVFSVIVRNSPSVQTRTDDSRTSRGLATWLPQDVLSTPPTRTYDTTTPGYSVEPGLDSACSGTTGTNILHMVWQENAGGGLETFVANYRFDAGAGRIKRFTCSSAGSYVSKVVSVTTPINASSASALTTPYSLIDPRIAFVDVRVQTPTGTEVLIRAASRNPAEELPN